MEISTLTFSLSGFTSSTVPVNSANGPAVTRTTSPFCQVGLALRGLSSDSRILLISRSWIGTGLLPELTKPVTTMHQLLTDKKLHGKVTLLNDAEDTLGLIMLENGDDPNKVTDASFNRALKMVQTAVKSGQVRQFTGNDYGPLLAKGDIIAATAWSGDIVQLQPDNKSLRWQLPKAGGIVWTDNMLIPKRGNAHLASIFMNFVYDPKIAAEIELGISYVCPVKGADKVLLKSNPEIAKNPLIFPSAATLARLHQNDPKALFNVDYKTKWQKLLGA